MTRTMSGANRQRLLTLGVLALVAWIGLIGAALAQSLTFPALTGRVVDEAGVIDAAGRAALTGQLAALEAKTSNQFVVVTLKSLRGTTIEDYGYQLGRQWKIGQKDKDTGVLLIVAPNDRVVRIEVGYGLEGTLTDAATKMIIETMILPRFKAGDMPGGIQAGADQIIKFLAGEAQAAPLKTAGAPEGAPEQASIGPLIIIGLLAIGLLIFCAVTGGGLCQFLFQILYMMLLSGGGGGGGRSSGGDSGFSGRGGSFGGGGSSGRW